MVFFFFKQKTAYEMRISDCSSDVCSSDLTIASWAIGRVPLAKVEKGQLRRRCANRPGPGNLTTPKDKVETLPVEANTGSAYPGIVFGLANQIGRASCRERVCQYV